MTASPTELTLRKLRGDGWTAQVVEHWVPGANVRRDLFGFIDIVALRDGVTLGVQATSDGNIASRVNKIAASPHVAAVREAGWCLEVWGWKKRNYRWQERIVDVS